MVRFRLPFRFPAGALWLVLGAALIAAACGKEARTPVQTGAERLAANDFEALAGERVGLIVNHTSQVDTSHLIDRVDAAASVELGALFAPEHGLRGTAGAGEAVESGQDPRTETPIYSLYGDTRQPTQEMLSGLDALVFDVQDVGARFYTYITTMGLAMQAAAEADVRFVVLDRPNPLGGTYTSGFVLESEHQSFVGRYPLPVAHGMTVGEVARFIKGERLLPGLDSLALSVVEMDGWRRAMQWPETQREWPAPSPNLPTWETALVYPGMAFFEAVDVNEGRGTDRPFLQVGFPWPADDVQVLLDTLQARSLPGLAIDTTRFVPRPRSGAPAPRYEGDSLHGLRLQITDQTAVQPVEAGLHLLHAAYHRAQARGDTSFVSRPAHLTRLAGTDRLRDMLEQGVSAETLVTEWTEDVDAFRDRRRPFLLYD
ncbi:MAG: exo-beta-N-acetylmuramidase NamZ domain-containing protein [Salinivenus sp.]